MRRDTLAWLVVIIGFGFAFAFAVLRCIFDPYDPLLVAGMYGSGLFGCLIGFIILWSDKE